MNLYEKHRPTEWKDVAGQDQAVSELRALAAAGLGGQAIWLSGQSGGGKTTLARITAAQVADEFFVREMDADRLDVETLESIEREQSLCGWGKGGRAYIVNEAHGLRSNIIRRLLVMLEAIPSHVIWIFTTTTDGQQRLFNGAEDPGPLLSRCACITLAVGPDVEAASAKRLQSIARSEGLDGQPISAYRTLFSKHNGNMRSAIQDIQLGRMRVGAAKIVARPTAENRRGFKRTCVICDAEFTALGKAARTCSAGCAATLATRNRKAAKK